MTIKECKDLEVYRLSFEMAMEIFQLTRPFPVDEKFSLVGQIVRSSRSVAANISEGFAKRKYKDVFARHLNDALGSSEETVTWLEFSSECGYIEKEKCSRTVELYKKIGAMIYKLMIRWQKF